MGEGEREEEEMERRGGCGIERGKKKGRETGEGKRERGKRRGG